MYESFEKCLASMKVGIYIWLHSTQETIEHENLAEIH